MHPDRANSESQARPSASEAKYDLSAIDELIESTAKLTENIDERLAGSVYAGFWLEGSKGGPTDALNRNIGEVLELKRALEGLTPVMQKAVKPVTHADDKEAKKPGKANANMTATIRNVIEQEVSGKIRDLQIENSGLKLRVEQAEKKNNDLSRELTSVKSQVKKATVGGGSGSGDSQAISRKIAHWEREVRQSKVDKDDFESAKSKLSTMRNEVWRIDAQLQNIKQFSNWTRSQIDALKSSAQSNAARISVREASQRNTEELRAQTGASGDEGSEEYDSDDSETSSEDDDYYGY